MAEEFAVHLQRTFEEMHSQLEEREQLLDAKLKSIDRTHNYQLKRVKLMSIPVTILSLVAVVYLFYVVRVMETAMTSMSAVNARSTPSSVPHAATSRRSTCCREISHAIFTS